MGPWPTCKAFGLTGTRRDTRASFRRVEAPKLAVNARLETQTFDAHCVRRPFELFAMSWPPSPPPSDTEGTRSAPPKGFLRPRPPRRSAGVDAHAVASALLAVADVTILVFTIAGVNGNARLILGLVLVCCIPGWAIVGPFHLENPALEIGLTVAASWSVLMLVAQVLMTIHAWHLASLEIATAVACLPSLVLQTHLFRRSRSR